MYVCVCVALFYLSYLSGILNVDILTILTISFKYLQSLAQINHTYI